MKKFQLTKNPLVLLLIAVLLVQSALLTYLFIDNQRIKQQIDDASMDYNLLSSEIINQKSLLRPVVSPKENLVIIPELDIALPYNDITKTLQYYSDDGIYYRFTSTQTNQYNDAGLRQLSCMELSRINFEDGNPFSPWEVGAGSVKLADGRELFITKPIAIEREEASTTDCEKWEWTSLHPDQVAEEMQKATSY